MPKIVGIDLGTTNSLVAIVEDGTPRVLPGREGRMLVPSVIYFDEGGNTIVGNPAKDKMVEKPKNAGRIAGLDVLRIVNEPTAASLAYGLDKQKQGTIAVYDFGGGTFDISILKLSEGIFEVLSTSGDTHLGGDDIDEILIRLVLDELQKQPDLHQLQAIRKAVNSAKENLSKSDIADIVVEEIQYRRS